MPKAESPSATAANSPNSAARNRGCVAERVRFASMVLMLMVSVGSARRMAFWMVAALVPVVRTRTIVKNHGDWRDGT
jgi:hypothetical protein